MYALTTAQFVQAPCSLIIITIIIIAIIKAIVIAIIIIAIIIIIDIYRRVCVYTSEPIHVVACGSIGTKFGTHMQICLEMVVG